MSKKRYLTKSRYKIAMDCPTKLYYSQNNEYGSLNDDNSFLEALAEGGFQVGALARAYYPAGFHIETLDYENALKETHDLLKKKDVTIFEAAIRYQDLFIRVDILKKTGNHYELIEVKSSSFDPTEENPFYYKKLIKKGMYKLRAEWKDYLYDVAFQTYVMKKAFPKAKTTPFLMLTDTTKVTTVEGLNQKFFLKNGKEGRGEVIVAEGLKKEDLGDEILVKVKVDHQVSIIHDGLDGGESRAELGKPSFEEEIAYFAKKHKENKKIHTEIDRGCKGCEFRIGSSLKAEGKKSGFDECWVKALKLRTKEITEPLVFDVWYLNSKELIDGKRYFAKNIKESDIGPEAENIEPGLTRKQRQWIQVEKIKNKDNEPYIDSDGLRTEINSWKYPLHFIDFETSRVAVPFHKGRRPYEQIAFQFSHHVVYEDGTVEHKGEWINIERGKFPNFDFVRALKRELEGDQGTIFRYHNHENSVLCDIYNQLEAMDKENVPDRQALLTFIRSITKKSDGKKVLWEGKRNMVDLHKMVTKYYYSPHTEGSCSLKYVLPAILNDSKYLQEKYANHNYGSHGYGSHNYEGMNWIQYDDNGRVKDPYKLLPPIFNDLDCETLDLVYGDEGLADGGAAMMAYAKMQFTQMSEEEATLVKGALLKYCELDTLAMVMIFEHWREEVAAKSKKKKVA